MKLRVATEACVQRGVEQRVLPAGAVVRLVAVEESLHALAVAELDDGESCLLFEEAAEARWTETSTARELWKAIAAFLAQQQTRGAFDRRMQAACGDLAGTIEALPRVQQGVGETGVQKAGFTACVCELHEEFFEAREI